MKYVELMTRQMQDLACATKLVIMLEEIFLKKWDKILHSHEKTSLKTAKTHLNKVIDNINFRMDKESAKQFLYLLTNTSLLNLPRKEVNESMKNLEKDTRVIDFALKNCNPCRDKDAVNCELRQVLIENKYPALWDSEYMNFVDLTEEEVACMNHCKYCVNIKFD